MLVDLTRCKPEEILSVPVEDLKPHPINNKIYGDEGDAPPTDLLASIASIGIDTPLEITNDGTVVKGHRRLKCAKHLGHLSVPCRVRNDLHSESSIQLALVTDNLYHRMKTIEQITKEYHTLTSLITGYRNLVILQDYTNTNFSHAVVYAAEKFASNMSDEDIAIIKAIVDTHKVSEHSQAGDIASRYIVANTGYKYQDIKVMDKILKAIENMRKEGKYAEIIDVENTYKKGNYQAAMKMCRHYLPRKKKKVLVFKTPLSVEAYIDKAKSLLYRIQLTLTQDGLKRLNSVIDQLNVIKKEVDHSYTRRAYEIVDKSLDRYNTHGTQPYTDQEDAESEE